MPILIRGSIVNSEREFVYRDVTAAAAAIATLGVL
jgi:hypothetical protein